MAVGLDRELAELSEIQISQLIERVPAAMTILGPLGIDLCCGGAHPVGEALVLHGIDPEPVLIHLHALLQESAGEQQTAD